MQNLEAKVRRAIERFSEVARALPMLLCYVAMIAVNVALLALIVGWPIYKLLEPLFTPSPVDSYLKLASAAGPYVLGTAAVFGAIYVIAHLAERSQLVRSALYRAFQVLIGLFRVAWIVVFLSRCGSHSTAPCQPSRYIQC